MRSVDFTDEDCPSCGSRSCGSGPCKAGKPKASPNLTAASDPTTFRSCNGFRLKIPAPPAKPPTLHGGGRTANLQRQSRRRRRREEFQAEATADAEEMDADGGSHSGDDDGTGSGSVETDEDEAEEKKHNEFYGDQLKAMEAECQRLRVEVAACEEALASTSDRDRLPVWAQRCTWRDELDVRAGQLERISLQFDATKRSLDAANEELQWQATSAEALRMRLADAVRAARAEDHRTGELRGAHRQSIRAVEELLKRWTSPDGKAMTADPTGSSLPLVVQQAQWLLDQIRSEAPETFVPDGVGGDASPGTGERPGGEGARVFR